MNLWIKIGEWIKGLATWAKAMITIITLGGILTGGYFTLEGRIINNYEEQTQEKQRITDIQKMQDTVDTLVYLIGDLSVKVDNNIELSIKSSEDIGALQQSWGNWLYTHKDQDPLTEKTFVEFMETLGFDLKKNSMNNEDMTASDK